jgi:tetratricopeptide (TPR) repeat protein
MTQIYISSTYSDLVDERRKVYNVLRKMRYDVIAMEDYVATDERPLDKCLADVAASQLYVGIFAWRYGYIPPGQKQSITELEYLSAREVGVERLIFILHEDAPWPHSRMEEGRGRTKIKALRAELSKTGIVQFFHSPEELAAQVAAAVDVWAAKRLEADMGHLRASQAKADERRREMREKQHVVNVRPLDVTHTFKDRVAEMRAMCDHLADAGVRLVSLVGRGGMGKTALASRVLADLERGKLPLPGEDKELAVDGILYLSARSTGLGLERLVADAGRMLGEPAAGELAARWADQEATLAAKVEALLEKLSNGLYLILLDNLEDALTAECEIAEEGLRLFVERCLTQPGGARLIATSREEVRLAGAALRGARSVPLRDGLPEDDAVALLRDLDPQGRLGLRDAPEADLRRAAQLTRGIPRALEMLAGILDRDPSASLRKLLADERLFGAQVVEALVAEGYRHLGEDERRIMEALAVFDPPVTDTAVAYLLHPWLPGLDVRAGLRHMVSSYFVSANRLTGEYSLHPLDREYAYGHLTEGEEVEEAGEEEESASRLREEYEKPGEAYTRRNLELRAAQFHSELGKPQAEWKTLDDLAPQLAELEHRVRAGDYDGACGILNQIDFDYLFAWGYYTRLAEMREKLQGHLESPKLQKANLGSLGFAYYILGRVERAIEFYTQALAIGYEIDDLSRAGQYLGDLGAAHYSLGNWERAMELYEQALAIASGGNDPRVESRCLGGLGRIYYSRGQIKQAIEFCEKALARAGESGDRRRESIGLRRLGDAYSSLGYIEKAIEFCEEALAISRESNYHREEGASLISLGRAYHILGQYKRMAEYLEEALSIARQDGHRRHEGRSRTGLGIAYRALRELDRAIEFQQEALSIAREVGHRRGESASLLELGYTFSAAGRFSEAQQCCEEALALDTPWVAFQAALLLGIILLRQHDPAAGETFADAVARCRAMLDQTAELYDARYDLAAALAGSAVCDPRWAEAGQRATLLAPALDEYRRALGICAAPGVVGEALRDLELIRAAGVEGLEQAFELLRGALHSASPGSRQPVLADRPGRAGE